MSESRWIDKIKAIGFDVDGTLYRFNPELGAWITKRLIKTVAEKVGKPSAEVLDEYERRRDEFGSTTLTLNSYGLDGEQVFQTLFDEAPLEKYVLPDGRLAKMLEKLSKKYKLFIISNGIERQVRRKLQFLEIDAGLFDPLVACYDHDGWIKPNPASFLYCLEKLDVLAEEVLYVGDRESTDIEGAQGVEMKTVMVWGESDMADVSLPTVYSLEELLL